MKILYFGLIPLLAVSCGGTDNVSTVSNEKNNSKFLADSSKQRLLKIIEGGWVNEEYLNILVQLNSPMKALAFGFPRQQMAFDISNLKGDTLVNPKVGIYSNDGDRFDLVFYKKQDGNVGMKVKDDSHQAYGWFLDYSFEKNDTVLILTMSDGWKSWKNRFNRQFRKFPESDNVAYSPREYCVNKNLFAGDWKQNGQTISFSADGRIDNFENFKRYSVSTFEENAVSSPDKISFYNDSADVTYGFTIVQERLRLYEIKISDTKYSRGKMIAEMSRK